MTNSCKEFPRNSSSAILPIKRSGFTGDWRSSVEVVLFDFFVLSVQLAMVIATVSYFCGVLDGGDSYRFMGQSLYAENSNTKPVARTGYRSHALLAKPKDFIDYIKKIELAENAKDCWLSLTRDGRTLPNCPLTPRVQTALRLGNATSVRSCWDMLNHADVISTNVSVIEMCLQ